MFFWRRKNDIKRLWGNSWNARVSQGEKPETERV